MTINERIKFFRKDVLHINQKKFASELGLTQSGVSYMEQIGSNVSDSSIKSICSMYNLNENWLRYGSEPMYIQSPTFSLDAFVKNRGATGLELEIIKTYFELDPEIRKAALDHFRNKLAAAVAADPTFLVPDTAEELEALYPPIDIGDSNQTGPL